jgi:hypothetical protein
VGRKLLALWAVVVAALLAIGVAKGHGGLVAAIVVVIALHWAAAWYWLERPFARDRTRRAKGQSLHCGYDLTGNVSGVCPECGSTK